LAGFQSALKDFEDEGIKIIAGSVDPLDKTEEFLKKLGVSYPVAYGMDMEETCLKTGAFYEKDRKFIQPACFLLRPDKTIEVAAYSSGPIGRFVPQDVLSLVRFYKSRAKK
jgi:peroxiredoxin